MKALRVLLRPWRGVWFALLYLLELVEANAVVAWEVITPTHSMRPGIVRVPTGARTDLELAILANLISFTPGTFVIEVDEVSPALYVHALHVRTPEDVRRRVERLERRLRWVVA